MKNKLSTLITMIILFVGYSFALHAQMVSRNEASIKQIAEHLSRLKAWKLTSKSSELQEIHQFAKEAYKSSLNDVESSNLDQADKKELLSSYGSSNYNPIILYKL